MSIIHRAGSRPSTKGPEANFTGAVRVDPLFQMEGAARTGAGLVTFEPGARSAWHTHPLGQALLVVSGVGWTQCEGEPKQEVRPGDVILCPPARKHWRGATATTGMSHIAIQDMQNGKNVEWLEKISDADYLR